VTLDEGEVESVGQRELGDVAGRVFLLLVGLKAGCEDENIMTFKDQREILVEKPLYADKVTARRDVPASFNDLALVTTNSVGS
jgi:hypothetical protein